MLRWGEQNGPALRLSALQGSRKQAPDAERVNLITLVTLSDRTGQGSQEEQKQHYLQVTIREVLLFGLHGPTMVL